LNLESWPILNLATWFGLHTLFARVDERHAFGMVLQAPVLTTLNVVSLILSITTMIAIFRFRVGMIRTLFGCSAAGLLIGLFSGDGDAVKLAQTLKAALASSNTPLIEPPVSTPPAIDLDTAELEKTLGYKVKPMAASTNSTYRGRRPLWRGA